jgi:hypothetical protein
MMQIFNQEYKPEWWVVQGTMPVMFAADMFLNFNYFGLVPYALIWLLVNELFVTFFRAAPRSFVALSCLFLSITVLIMARGGGVEQWLVYYLFGAPVILAARLASNALRRDEGSHLRWVV